MNGNWLTLVGLMIDVFGAFLLSAEAIKVENLRTFRERYLYQLLGHARSRKFAGVPPDELDVQISEAGIQWSFSKTYPNLFQSLHFVAGFLMLLLINWLSSGRVFEWLVAIILWVLECPWYLALPVAVYLLFFFSMVVLWGLGELLHEAMMSTTKRSIDVLIYIEENTPNGAVGIIGFLLLFTGFLFQILGTVSSLLH